MPAQAVSGYCHGLPCGKRPAGSVQLLPPALHVGDLPKRKAEGLDLASIGRLVIARGVVEELGRTEGENIFVTFLIPKKRSAESGAGVLLMPDDCIASSELGSQGWWELTGAFVAQHKRSITYLIVEPVKQSFAGHLDVCVARELLNGRSSHDFYGDRRLWGKGRTAILRLQLDQRELCRLVFCEVLGPCNS